MLEKQRPRGTVVVSVVVAVALLVAALAAMFPIAAAAPSSAGIHSAGSEVRAPATPSAACGQTPIPLGSASAYGVLAGSTVTSTGAATLTGDLGLSPGSAVTGFPPGKITGTENVDNLAAKGAEANLTIAYNNATPASRANCPVTLTDGENLAGLTLAPGLYWSAKTLEIEGGSLTLSGGGNPNAVFVFQLGSALTTTSGSKVILTNGAQSGNVFWQVGSSATLGTTSVLQGTILAADSISMLTGSVLNGRALAESGEVSLEGSTITVPTPTTSTTYAVTFTETGLAAGTSWSVGFGGVSAASTTTTIGFSVESGTFQYAINVVGYAASPSTGSLSVDGAATGQTIVCTAASSGDYGVTFTEAGLTAATNWSVTLNGAALTSDATTIAFTMGGGTYEYTVGAISNFTASPTLGTVEVNGAPASVPIAFTAGTPSTYSVTFSESGLAPGSSWSITFGGVPGSSTTTTMAFIVVAGTFQFTAVATGYAADPSSGTVPVNGAGAHQAVVFTAIGPGPETFSVTFTESGLASGTSWSVTLNQVQQNSSTSTLVFQQVNGTTAYTVGGAAGYTESPAAGNVNVSGAGSNQALVFTSMNGGGGGTSSSTSVPAWEWALLAIAAVGVVAGIALAISRRNRA
jgi:hypothetical protein